MRVGVKRDRGDLVSCPRRRLDSAFRYRASTWSSSKSVGRHLAARQAVEHEGVVGIGTVGDTDLHRGAEIDGRETP